MGIKNEGSHQGLGGLRVEKGERTAEKREGAPEKGCLKSHYELLSKFSIIIILMALISL